MSEEINLEVSFDFQNHKQKAILDYIKVQPLYEAFSNALKYT